MTKIRCAIYTRKSAEEGLEQDFNSLDAQREACAAYVASQKAEGWVLLPTVYEDAGISGGTLERPGLQRLLADIDAGLVEQIVVYKVDRLTRSLSDFAKLVERLEAAGAVFVSVTQSFNTATSMGRLTLHMLLSFAQFEREVTAERIRDKVAASKRKGLWMGGRVPLGYEKDERTLRINEAEAETVRTLYALYRQHGTLRQVKADADRMGLRTKRRFAADGTLTGGLPFRRGHLHCLLTNPLYAGRIRHQRRVYEGQHPSIIAPELWDIEAEFAPARTVVADAEKRLPKHPLLWRGLPVSCAFTLVYPKSLQGMPESRARTELETCNDLRFSQLLPKELGTQYRLFADLHSTATSIGTTGGSIRTLADCLHSFWLRAETSSFVEDTIREASSAIARASEFLKNVGALHPHAGEDSDAAATSALIWLNALLFQELLAQNLAPESLPEEHRNKRIRPPDPEADPDTLRGQWKDILDINWWPIFHYATEALRSVPSRPAALALSELQPVARTIAKRGVIRRHDIAGRIFHRLLKTRKFLATNYTTIPAAILLARLAFDREAEPWKKIVWENPKAIGKLRIADPACGTGTLLMAAVQEVLKQHRRHAKQTEEPQTVRTLLEQTIHGYDVVPAAIHLTAATLAMAESRQVVSDMPLYWMPHDVKIRPRLGSLDFLARSTGKGQADHLPMFPEATEAPVRTTGTGKRKHDVLFMPDCDLVIANPPYTRAGGPGSRENTAWNPIFGSVLSKKDADKMNRALQRTLNGTPASTYAGLGSAFITLADEKLKPGGRLAFVLPATALTGSRWAPIRKLLLDKYNIEWVVVSHDERNRAARRGLPGRLYVGFSESTRIAETLIVATKAAHPGDHRKRSGVTRFVNLRRNPDEPIDAIAIARAILSMKTRPGSRPNVEVSVGSTIWGEIQYVPQAKLNEEAWLHTVFVQSRLAEATLALQNGRILNITNKELRIPITRLGTRHDLGPYEMQIKNPKQGLFTITETNDPRRAGHPALWHHSSTEITTLERKANARLHERDDKSSIKQKAMLARSGHLHIARELRHAPQRLAAVVTKEAMLGVRSWITAIPKERIAGEEEALCLWLNSTPGLMLRLGHANRPYLGRSAVPHELLYTFPILAVEQLSKEQRRAARELFSDLKGRPLQGFAQLAEDPVRRELDHRLFAEVLGHDFADGLDKLAEALNREPTITARH